MKRALSIFCVLILMMTMVASANAAVAVKSVTLNKTSVTLEVGKTFQLKATVSPSNASNKKVTYSSTKTTVATVSSSGLITAKGIGSCTITAKSNNGKKATVTVKVIQPAVTSVKLDKTSINMLGKSVTLKATCQPSGSNQKVTWSSSNKKIATVSSSGVVTPKGYGTCTITAKSDNGKTAKCTVTINRENYKETSHVVTDVWPYYAKDKFWISVDGLTGKIVNAGASQSVSTGLAIKLSKEGIERTSPKNFSSPCDYVEFQSSYSIFFGINFRYLPLGCTMIQSYNRYSIDSNGNLTVLDKSCDSSIFSFLCN